MRLRRTRRLSTGVGVARDVGEGLDGDAARGDLHDRGQRRQAVGRDLDRPPAATGVEPVAGLLDGRDQAESVEVGLRQRLWAVARRRRRVTAEERGQALVAAAVAARGGANRMRGGPARRLVVGR
jgi:hypothetical protein